MYFKSADILHLVSWSFVMEQLITFGLGDSTPEGCPKGWVHFRNHCYNFISGEVHFDTAKAVCLMKGATVASIWQQEELKFASENLKQVLGETQSAWVGLVARGDAGDQHTWQWMDGSGPALADTPQPSPDICGSLTTEGSLTFQTCDNMVTGFICKKPLQIVYLPDHYISNYGSSQGNADGQVLFQRLRPPVLDRVLLQDSHHLATTDVKEQTDCANYCYISEECLGFSVTCRLDNKCDTFSCSLFSGVTNVLQ